MTSVLQGARVFVVLSLVCHLNINVSVPSLNQVLSQCVFQTVNIVKLCKSCVERCKIDADLWDSEYQLLSDRLEVVCLVNVHCHKYLP